MVENDEDTNCIRFFKTHGFLGDWSNAVESTYDLQRILEYCLSNMPYSEKTKQKIKDLLDHISDYNAKEGEVFEAGLSN